MKRVGVVGLGAMGAGIAQNIAAAGFDLMVFDVMPEVRGRFEADGFSVAASIADLASDVDAVLLSLPGPAEIVEVCLGPGGLAGALASGTLVIDLSTNNDQTIRRLARELDEHDIGFLEAPVSGGPWGARDGTLAIWVGGAPEDFAVARPIFAAIGAHVFHMGALGAGTATKLTHNLGASIRSLLVAEMLAFGVAHGIDPLRLFAAVREGSHGRVRTFDLLGFKNLDQTYETPAFRLRHARKDMGIAMAAAAERGLELPATAACLALLDEGMAKGMADLDSTSICRLIEERSGTTFPPVAREEIDDVLAGNRDGRLA